MLVLGWHGGITAREAEDLGMEFSSHDGAAVLLQDGHIVSAIEEERLNRVKHSSFFPARAIRFCLAESQKSITDLDFIVTDFLDTAIDSYILIKTLIDGAQPLLSGRQWVARMFEREFKVDLYEKLRFYPHHLAHLHGAWVPSGFEEALVLSLDGSGEGVSGQVASCGPKGVASLLTLPASQSLGHFYTLAISLLGYRRFDEYKVMGLAPYGDPNVYKKIFDSLYELLPGGQYNLVSDEKKLALLTSSGFLDHVRRKGQPFTQVHRDFAAGLQSMLETIVVHLVRHFCAETGLDSLCLSGGVAHNCTLNGKLLRSGLFKRVYIQPAAHDAGNALGAAIGVLRESGQPIARNLLPHVFLGTDIGTETAIATRLADWAPLIEFRHSDDSAVEAARLLANGQVIGWVQGRSEFGPRALGNRSILADPRPAENKTLINAMIKKREGYRPFAPAVLEERVQDYFELPVETNSVPFMTFVLPVQLVYQKLLGAVTHVDGTARVQSVAASTNPRFHALIAAFEKESGVPIVLNTSFNNDAEPIVDSIDDAVATFLTTGIQYLVIGDYIVSKVSDLEKHPSLIGLVPIIPAHRKMVRRLPEPGQPIYQIESTANDYFVETTFPLSVDAFYLLLDDDKSAPISQRADRLGIAGDRLENILIELFELWQRRFIWLKPHTY